MDYVESADGTKIAFERIGSGPALILASGAFCDRRTFADLAALLAQHFTVTTYDRRGRGDSGDTQPYAVAREVEDIAALIAHAGTSVFLYGHSSGAILAVEAAAAGLAIDKLAVYDPPYVSEQVPGLTDRVRTMALSGDREGAATAFLTEAIGVPAEFVPMIKQGEDWNGMLGIAHTLWYDLMICSRDDVPVDQVTGIGVETLAMAGANSPDDLRRGSERLAAAMPNARLKIVEGQDHRLDNQVIAPILIDYFSG